MFEQIDKQYWGQYLNLDKLNQWTKQNLCVADERQDCNIRSLLSECLLYQNLIERAKDVKI